MFSLRGFFVSVLLSAALAPAAVASSATSEGKVERVFTIAVAAPTAAKDVQVRYFIGGESEGTSSSAAAISADNKIVILATRRANQSGGFRAIAYAPGCRFATFSVDDLSSAAAREGEFQCLPLPVTFLQGRMDLAGFQGKNLQVEVLYVGHWAPEFLNMGQGSISPLVAGKEFVATDGSFSVALPDFASDPLWDSFSKDAALRFRLVDAATGEQIAFLAPPADLSEGKLLRVAASYPDEVPFTLEPRK